MWIFLWTSQITGRIHEVNKPYCVKSVCIGSYSGPHFPVFGLNTERYGVGASQTTWNASVTSGYHFQTLKYVNLDIISIVNGVYSARFLKYVWPFFNIMKKSVKNVLISTTKSESTVCIMALLASVFVAPTQCRSKQMSATHHCLKNLFWGLSERVMKC